MNIISIFRNHVLPKWQICSGPVLLIMIFQAQALDLYFIPYWFAFCSILGLLEIFIHKIFLNKSGPGLTGSGMPFIQDLAEYYILVQGSVLIGSTVIIATFTSSIILQFILVICTFFHEDTHMLPNPAIHFFRIVILMLIAIFCYYTVYPRKSPRTGGAHMSALMSKVKKYVILGSFVLIILSEIIYCCYSKQFYNSIMVAPDADRDEKHKIGLYLFFYLLIPLLSSDFKECRKSAKERIISLFIMICVGLFVFIIGITLMGYSHTMPVTMMSSSSSFPSIIKENGLSRVLALHGLFAISCFVTLMQLLPTIYKFLDKINAYSTVPDDNTIAEDSSAPHARSFTSPDIISMLIFASTLILLFLPPYGVFILSAITGVVAFLTLILILIQYSHHINSNSDMRHMSSNNSSHGTISWKEKIIMNIPLILRSIVITAAVAAVMFAVPSLLYSFLKSVYIGYSCVFKEYTKDWLYFTQ